MMAEIDTKPISPADEIAELKRQMEQMQERLAQLSAVAGVDASRNDGAVDEAREAVVDDACEAAVSACAGVDDVVGAEMAVGADGGVGEADCGEPGDVSAFGEGAQAQSHAAVESASTPETAAPQVAASAQQGQSAHACGQGASQGYAAYVPPATPASASSAATYQHTAASSVQHPGAGAPTPPPDYDAAAAYANQGGASAPRAEYAQPTGQQAYQSNASHAAGYGSPSQAAYNPYTQTYYQQPVVRTKDHVAAGLLGVFLGTFGIHKFYLGYSAAGLIMLGVAILGGLLSFGLATMIVWLIGLIEGIIYLAKSQGEFEQAYVFSKREWF